MAERRRFRVTQKLTNNRDTIYNLNNTALPDVRDGRATIRRNSNPIGRRLGLGNSVTVRLNSNAPSSGRVVLRNR